MGLEWSVHTKTLLQLPITNYRTKQIRVTHQLHAKLMGPVLGMRVRRQRESTPTIWSELLLQQLSIQTTCERHLHISINMRSQCIKATSPKLFRCIKAQCVFTEVRTLVSGGNILKLLQACKSTGSRR